MAVTTTAAIIGASALAAGGIAAAGASSAANKAAKAQNAALSAQEKAAMEAEERRNEAVRLKQEAAKNINFPTYLEIPEAQQYKQTLEDRMAGRGLIDVNAQTSPIAAQVRAGLEKTTAAIGSAASARGLGRSTVATSQIGEASQAAERDIAERMANLELARQAQIEDAIRQFGIVSEKEATSQQQQAQFKQGAEFNIADTIAGNAEAYKQDQFAIANTIAQSGALEAAYALKNAEMWASSILGAGSSISSTESTNKIVDAIDKIQNSRSGSGAMVNIATKAGTMPQYQSIIGSVA